MRERLGLWWTRLRRRAIQLLTPGRSRHVRSRIFDGTPAMGGRLLEFHPSGYNLGRLGWRVVSKRGGFEMGRIEWSNQWYRAKFTPHPEAVFDQRCLAEIYACMREMK